MTDKTTAALKLAEEALETAPIEYDFHGEPVDKEFAELSNKALAAIREALANHSGDDNEMVAEPYACEAGECPDKSLCAGACECLFKAEPVKQEPVMDYEHICALRESEQIQAGDSYFFVRPENDTPTSRKMFFQGFERGFHKGLKYAAPVSAKRECVDLTDDEKGKVWGDWYVSGFYNEELIDRAIAAFKEKNK